MNTLKELIFAKATFCKFFFRRKKLIFARINFRKGAKWKYFARINFHDLKKSTSPSKKPSRLNKKATL